MKRKIVFFDTWGADSRYFKQSLKNLTGHEVVCTRESLNESNVGEYADATIVSVFVNSQLNKQVISSLPQLELIATRSTGFDHVDVGAASKHHTLLATVPSYGDKTVAEHVFLLLLAVARKYEASTQQLRDGVIEYQSLTGMDLESHTLGLIGCGRIGRQVANIATGFGMKVKGYDLDPRPHEAIEYVDFEEVVSSSDVISLHLPANSTTRHIIDKSTLSQMRRGVIIINTARGELVDTKALIDGLYSGQVGGAGLDVVEGEELLRFDEEIALLDPSAPAQDLVHKTEHSILLRMPNVVLTPHNAFNSAQALSRIRSTTIENIKQFLMHQPQNVVRHK